MARKTTFKENYIKTYYSQDYIWDSLNKVKVRRITSLVDTLALLGKDLLVVIAPGKVTFYPEYIPDHLKGVISTTNYEAFVHLVKEDQFQLIDFNAWFVNQKTKSEYSLYPKTGIHWSRYAMDLVIDSLLSYIENKRNIDIPDYIIGQPVLSEKLIDPNRDLEDDMNLLFDIPNQPMAYSDVSYDEVGKENPTSIVISDSFFWGLYRKGLRKLAFNNEEFWFYNREIYTPGGDSPG